MCYSAGVTRGYDDLPIFVKAGLQKMANYGFAGGHQRGVIIMPLVSLFFCRGRVEHATGPCLSDRDGPAKIDVLDRMDRLKGQSATRIVRQFRHLRKQK